MTPPESEGGLLEKNLAQADVTSAPNGAPSPYTREEEEDGVVFDSQSEVYTTLFGCLVSESSRFNLSLDEGFWEPYLYAKFQSQAGNASGKEWERLSGHPNGTVFVQDSAEYLGPGTTYYYGQGEAPEDLVNGILDQCLSLTSILTTPRPYLLVWWQQFLWTLVFGVMMTMAVGGNILVIWIICAHRRMRTVTNYFLLNLSAADLFMSVLNCMFNFIYMLHSDWPFGAVYCTISNFMANVTISASVFTLMALSFDRFIAIVRPLEPRMSKTVARVFILVIWGSSMLLSLPCLLFSTTVSIKYKNNEVRRGCILRWPDGLTSSSRQEHIYNVVFFITTYLLPMLVMLWSYFRIGHELWGSQSIGELTERQATSIRSKRRVVKMFLVIVAVFAVCWLPQQAFFLYTYHNSAVLDTAHIQHVYLTCYWLAMANAMINPVIYYWMNARFRAYFREVVLQCVCLQCHRRSPSYEGSPTLERRHVPCDDPSSRSRSDTRQGPNGTFRTTPASQRSNNHLLVYSSREGLTARNSCRLGGGGPQCNMCRQSLRTATLLNGSTLQMVPLGPTLATLGPEALLYRGKSCIQSQI
ncbi:LOW QUALITY PROTEIN: tachykinin-like peptides receptor 86C [Scylla paramamosain]|uniref:LOW QUALITY PROTEIN: tachykinin-like peptides receptor 86C n=1 Tax=Scylla paramamosain TaxID=85552 RepID=UPI00308381D5